MAVAAAKAKSARGRSWKGMIGLGLACLATGLSLQTAEARVPALVFVAAIALLALIYKPLVKRSQDKCFRTIFSEEQDFLNNQIMTIDQSGIACDMDGGKVISNHTWVAFVKRIDLPDAYVFLSTPNSFIRVPKQALPLSDLELVWQWSSMVPSA